MNSMMASQDTTRRKKAHSAEAFHEQSLEILDTVQ